MNEDDYNDNDNRHDLAIDFNDGYSYDEIADIMGLTKAQVKKIETQALKKLKLNKQAYTLFKQYVQMCQIEDYNKDCGK